MGTSSVHGGFDTHSLPPELQLLDTSEVTREIAETLLADSVSNRFQSEIDMDILKMVLVMIGIVLVPTLILVILSRKSFQYADSQSVPVRNEPDSGLTRSSDRKSMRAAMLPAFEEVHAKGLEAKNLREYDEGVASLARALGMHSLEIWGYDPIPENLELLHPEDWDKNTADLMFDAKSEDEKEIFAPTWLGSRWFLIEHWRDRLREVRSCAQQFPFRAAVIPSLGARKVTWSILIYTEEGRFLLKESKLTDAEREKLEALKLDTLKGCTCLVEYDFDEYYSRLAYPPSAAMAFLRELLPKYGPAIQEPVDTSMSMDEIRRVKPEILEPPPEEEEEPPPWQEPTVEELLATYGDRTWTSHWNKNRTSRGLNYRQLYDEARCQDERDAVLRAIRRQEVFYPFEINWKETAYDETLESIVERLKRA